MAHLSVTLFKFLEVANLVTPKAVTKYELLFNKPASEEKRWVCLGSEFDLSSTTKYGLNHNCNNYKFGHT